MSNVLTPIITNLGRDALMKGFSSPENYRFSQVALGDGGGNGYIPEPGNTALKRELQRIEVKSVVIQDSSRLHITAVAGLPGENEAADPFNIREIGFYLLPIAKNGEDEEPQILFAIYATEVDEQPLLTKEPATELLLAFDLLLPDAGDGNLNFDKDSYLHLPSASQDRSGMIRLSTDAETKKGELLDSAVSPAGLKLTLKEQTVSPGALQAAIAGFKPDSGGGTSDSVKGLAVSGAINFGTAGRQMINLWNTSFGIGIQNNTQYYRTAKNFAWFKNGVHDDKELNAGKDGSVQMVLNDGKLGIGVQKPAERLDVNGVVKAHAFKATGLMQHRMYPNDPLVYQDIFEAFKAKAIVKFGKPFFDNTTYTAKKPWHGRTIIRFGKTVEAKGNGALVTVPAGYDTVWVRVLGERWTIIQAYFTDGAKEDCGQWAGGFRSANCISPDGSLSDSYQAKHQWLPIPVGRAGKLALIAKKGTTSDFWVSGLAFSRNPWGHATQSARGIVLKINGGDATAWTDEWKAWNNDVLTKIEPNSNSELKVPVIANGKDKLLYLVEHNNNWNGCMHNGIVVNGERIERFISTYDNPFMRHWNGKFYNRYIAALVPAGLIKPESRWLSVQIDMTKQDQGIHFREIGTHDFDVPAN